MNLLRQLNARLLEGEQTNVAGSRRIPFKLTDVSPSVVLKLGDGECIHDSYNFSTGTSFVVPLPVSYTSADQLQVFLQATKTCKVVIVSPVEGTSTIILYGTDSSTDGDHFGVLSFTQRITSITITSAQSNVQVNYSLFKLPDLSLAASFRDGSLTTGVEE